MTTVNYPSGSGGGDWLPVVIPTYVLVWLIVLGAVLVRKDFDPVTRLTWVLVVMFVPVAGIFLYFFLSPVQEPKTYSPPAKGEHSLSGTPWENDPGHTGPRAG